MKTYLTESESYNMYDEMLDELESSENYDGSRIVKELDPIAYRCGYSDYMDSLAQDGYIIKDYNDEDIQTCSYCDEMYKMSNSNAEYSKYYCSASCEDEGKK